MQSSAPSAREDWQGRLLGGRYRLRRLLGEGGMGVVWEAHQEDLGRPVALKLITARGPDALLRFQREARAAAALGHPHIVQVFDFQAAPPEPPFLVMELLQGHCLQQIIRGDGPLPPTRAAGIGVQVLSALGAAHRAGIVHRDIKPANIFCSSSPTFGEVAKVLDFGVAKLLTGNGPQLTNAGDVVGTVVYMSPEQARGVGIDGRSDIYSLAACLYHCVTGKRPITSESTGTAVLAIVQGQITPLEMVRPDLDRSFCAIVRRAMAVDPAVRYASADEMAEALGAWLSGVAPKQGATFDRPAGTYGTAAGPFALAPASTYRADGDLGAASAAVPASFHAYPASMGPAVSAILGAWGGPSSSSYSQPAAAVTACPSLPSRTLGTAADGRPSGKGGAVAIALSAVGLVVVGGVVAATVLGSGSAGAGGTARASAASAAGATGAGARSLPSAASTSRSGACSDTASRPASAARAPAAASTSPASSTSTSPAAAPAATAAAPTARPTSEAGTCSPGLERCNGGCSDLNRDKNNCGTCGRACPSTAFCHSGNCVLCGQIGGSECNGVCVQTSHDFNNCGACGHRCPAGKMCSQGVCK